MSTGYPDWQVPKANATQIAATGVPLLAASALLLQQTFNPAAGATQSSLGSTFSQIGYDFTVQSSFSVAPTTPFIRVQLEWLDSGTSVRVATDTFVVPASTTPGAFTVHGSGQAKGDQCTVHVTNLDGLQVATVTVLLTESSRVPASDTWRWDNQANAGLTVTGWTLPVLPPDESVLGMQSGAVIAGGANGSWLCGMHDGLCWFSAQVQAGALANLVFQFAAVPSSAYTANNPLYNVTGAPSAFQFAGVRSPLRLIIHNNGTSSATVTWGLVRVPR